MKTTLKVILMFAFIAFANTLFASGNLRVNILPMPSAKAVIAISSLTNSNLKISVKDDNGSIVYYKETTDPNNAYRKVFDFSDLEDGSYSLSVVSKDLTTERQFQIKQGEINVGEEKTTIKPFFGYKEGILNLTYLNFANENLTFYIYEKNQLIYSKNIGREFNIVEALNLSKLDRGNYVAVLATGANSYSYDINID